MTGSSSQPLPEVIFGASSRFAELLHGGLDDSSRRMCKVAGVSSLASSAIELVARSFLIAKMIKEETVHGVSSSKFENWKIEFAESKKNLDAAFETNSTMNVQIKELSAQLQELSTAHENEKNVVKDEITIVISESLRFQSENQKLKASLSELSASKQAVTEKIQHLELEVNQLKNNASEAENYVVKQHKLGFSKTIEQAKYF